MAVGDMRNANSVDEGASEAVNRNGVPTLNEADDVIPTFDEPRKTENEDAENGTQHSSQRTSQRRLQRGNSSTSSHDKLNSKGALGAAAAGGGRTAGRSRYSAGSGARSSIRRLPTGVEPGNYADVLARSFNVEDPHHIGWAHAVNSIARLNAALNSPNVQMIEVDIMTGTFDPTSSGGAVVSCAISGVRAERHRIICCHAPYTTSDLSLRRLLELVCAHNEKVRRKQMRGDTLGALAHAAKEGNGGEDDDDDGRPRRISTTAKSAPGDTVAESSSRRGSRSSASSAGVGGGAASPLEQGRGRNNNKNTEKKGHKEGMGAGDITPTSVGSFLSSCVRPQTNVCVQDEVDLLRSESVDRIENHGRFDSVVSQYEIVVDMGERNDGFGKKKISVLGGLDGTDRLGGILKGIKLDFKSQDCIDAAIDLLEEFEATTKIPSIWLNADVCFGPGVIGQTLQTIPGKKFLAQCARVPDAVVSLGWLCTEYSIFHSKYSRDMIDDMLSLLKTTTPNPTSIEETENVGGEKMETGGGGNSPKFTDGPTKSTASTVASPRSKNENNEEENKYTGGDCHKDNGHHDIRLHEMITPTTRTTMGGSPTNQHITFAVNAYYLINSLPNLSHLIDSVTKAGWSASLTIWTGMGSFGVTSAQKMEMLSRTKEAAICAFIDVKIKRPGRSCGSECSIM